MSILESTLKTNHLELPSRLVFPPMGCEKANPDGTISKVQLDYYEAIAKNELLGLIIVEHSYITKAGKASPKQLSIASDDTIPGMKQLTDMLHRYGKKTVLQLNHAGGATNSAVTGTQIVSASPLQFGRGGEVAKELTLRELDEIKQDFVRAAIRAKEAGFDGVEIHSAHGYLLNQFYSPYLNQRTDAYGGSLKNRIRLHLKILEGVRKVVGENYPIFLRLGASDYMEGGTTIEDSIQAAKLLEQAGLDVLDVSGGLCGPYRPGHQREQGYFAELTTELKKHIEIPVILTGGIRELKAAEQHLQNQAADLIGIGRPIFQNQNWINEAEKEWKNEQ